MLITFKGGSSSVMVIVSDMPTHAGWYIASIVVGIALNVPSIVARGQVQRLDRELVA